MRGSRVGVRALAVTACLFSTWPRPVRAEDVPPQSTQSVGGQLVPAGPRQGGGRRSISVVDAMPAEAPSKATPEPADRRRPHQVGKAPKSPKTTLPAGVERPEPDASARRKVAGGPTEAELRAGVDDPELRALREAERVLFPEPLAGAEPGWSWELPTPLRSRAGAEVSANGLPSASVRDFGRRDQPSETEAEWLKRLSMPNLPVRLDPRVIKYLKFYRDSARGRAVARAWAQKSGRFAGALKAELAKAGLPTDLVWLSLVESGHNPTIRSHAGAVGIWQFLAESGRLYGLTVDRWVDERLDPQRSTEAAIGYLSDLYRRFGTWELAMAAYNMGHAGLLRAMRKFNTNDFWELSRYEAGVPWETNLYVPKILATAIVMNNKRAFGIDDVIPETPVGFDTVLVDPGTLLEDVARAAEVTPEQIKALNRHYLAGRTPPSAANEPGRSWPVRVPSKSGVVATQRLSKQAKQPESLEPYIVRVGDTLSSIAQGAGGNEARVRSINRISPEEPLQPGTVLLVPQAAEGATSSSSEEVVVVPPRQFSYPDRMRVFYRIVAGDTLGRIAQAFGVAASELLAWNALDDSARLHVGLVLQIFVKKGQKLAHVRHTRESRARVLVAGSVDFYDYYEGLRGKKRIVVVARAGETLQSVGKRFNMSPGWIERINRRSRRDKLGAGENVVVYVDRATPKRFAAGAAEAESLPQIAPPAPNALPVAAPAPKLGAAEAKTPVTE